MKKKVCSFLLCLVSARALAWGELGHGAIGEIAERNLNPKAKAFVASILGAEPLAIASSWPDEVRSDERFASFAPYHFAEVPQGFSYNQVPLEKRAAKDAYAILSQAPAFLVQSSNTRDQKLVVLRYLAHVVGDVQQPLHVGNGVDRGANLCEVSRANPFSGRTESFKLHAFWDDKVFDPVEKDFREANPGKYFGYQQLVELILKEHSFQRRDTAAVKGDLDKASVELTLKWFAESQKLHKDVYPDSSPVTKPEMRPYCKAVDPTTGQVVEGAFDKNKIPFLNDKYLKNSLKLAKLRVLKGGLRLAQLLNTIAEHAPPSGANVQDILNSVQLLNQKAP